MWHIQNNSNEILKVVESVNTSTPGYRLRESDWPRTTLLKPDESLCFSTTEPGLMVEILSKENPEKAKRLSLSEDFRATCKSP